MAAHIAPNGMDPLPKELWSGSKVAWSCFRTPRLFLLFEDFFHKRVDFGEFISESLADGGAPRRLGVCRERGDRERIYKVRVVM